MTEINKLISNYIGKNKFHYKFIVMKELYMKIYIIKLEDIVSVGEIYFTLKPTYKVDVFFKDKNHLRLEFKSREEAMVKRLELLEDIQTLRGKNE